MKKYLNKALIGMGLGLLAGGFVLLIINFIQPDLWDDMENKFYDYRYKWNYTYRELFNTTGIDGTEEIHTIDDVAIINIDDLSMSSKKLGAYMRWPRSYHGEISKYMKEGNASVTAFDILFMDADFGKRASKRVIDIINDNDKLKLKKNTYNKLKQTISNGVNYDQMFVDKTKEAKNVIHALQFNEKSDYENQSDYIEKTKEKYRLQMNPGSAIKCPDNVKELFYPKPILDGAFTALAKASNKLGFVNVIPDEDGVNRRIPLFLNFNDYLYPTIGLQAVLNLISAEEKDIKIEAGKFVDIGKPFWIKKEDKNILKISYPGFNSNMLIALLDSKKDINKLKEGESAQITEGISVSCAIEDGYISVSLLSGMATIGILKDLNRISIDKIKSLPNGSEAQIGPSTVISKDENGEIYISDIQEEEELEEISISTIKILSLLDFNKIQSLKKGDEYIVSYPLTVQKKNGKLKTEYLTLRGKTLDDVLKLKVSDIGNLKVGKKLTFGNNIKIPIDNKGCMIIKYMGNGGANRTFKYISYCDVYDKRIPKEWFSGKAFIIGSSAAALFDLGSSPTDRSYPNVEIHSTVLYNIINSDFMRKIDLKYMILLLLILAGIMGIITNILKPYIASVLMLIAIGVYIFITQGYFNDNLWIDTIKPLMAILASFLTLTLYHYITEEKDKKFLKATFQNYLSPELIDQMYESKQMPELGGDEGIRTAYFTDIQAFSTFSEQLGSPTRLVELLNEYLTAMTDILLANEGTLDKYEGDAIIAFFGAPMPLKDHAIRGVRTAIHMQRKLLELREKWKSEGDKWPIIVKEMRMRIGVNSGPIVTGNMGSTTRMNYTMMGDTVNLAARLEEAAKQYGIYTMISHFTAEMLEDSFELREVDCMRVVGKSEAVTTFEVMEEKGKVSELEIDLLESYNKGLGFYKKQEWDSAIQNFIKSEKLEIERYPDAKTNPSRVYIDRCNDYKIDSPGKDWDGVFTLTSK